MKKYFLKKFAIASLSLIFLGVGCISKDTLAENDEYNREIKINTISKGTDINKINGWHLSDNKEKYFVDGKYLTGLNKVGQTIYLFNSNGEKQKGWHRLENKDFYFDIENGGMLTGKRTIGKTTYLLTSNYGKKYGWHLLEGNAYYFSKEFGGGMITGIRKVGKGTYFLTSNGKLKGWHLLDGKSYYFSEDNGVLLKVKDNKINLENTQRYYVTSPVNVRDLSGNLVTTFGKATTLDGSIQGNWIIFKHFNHTVKIWKTFASTTKPVEITNPTPVNNKYDINKIREYFLKRINQDRKERGLKPVVFSDALNRMAQIRSDEMAKHNFYEHERPNGEHFTTVAQDFFGHKYYSKRQYEHFWYLGTENINVIYPDRGEGKEAIYQEWKDSEGHFENMMDYRVSEIGLALSPSVDKYGTNIFYATQIGGIYTADQ